MNFINSWNAGNKKEAANNATYNVDLVGGTAFISGDGTAEGLTVDNDGKVFIGQGTPTAAFADTLNIKGGIRFTNTDAPTIKPTATTSSTSGQSVTIEGGSSAGAAAGHLNLTGGTASGNGAGGNVVLTAGRDTSGSSDGTIQLKTYTSGTATAGLTVEREGQDVTVNTGNLVVAAAAKGIVHTGKGTVTQATDHTTAVTINATSGVITLAAVALSAANNAEYDSSVNAAGSTTPCFDSIDVCVADGVGVIGCTDNSAGTNFGVALNYNANAVIDDGSCQYCHATNGTLIDNAGNVIPTNGDIAVAGINSFTATPTQRTNSNDGSVIIQNVSATLNFQNYITSVINSNGVVNADFTLRLWKANTMTDWDNAQSSLAPNDLTNYSWS